MTAPIPANATPPLPLGAAPRRSERAELRRLSHQLEGVFLNQLFQAMRATIPQEADGADNAGKEMFTSLLDERLAGVAADRMKRGIGEALYRELARRLPPEATNEGPKP